MSHEAWYAAGKALRQPPRSGFQYEACHEYSSMESRICDRKASQNNTPSVPHSQGPELLRALCLANGTTEMRPSSGLSAEVWRFENEATFNQQHWLLCHMGLYEFEFEFEFAPSIPMRVAWRQHRRVSAPMFIYPHEIGQFTAIQDLLRSL